ncbi:hypothetical protein ACLKA7_001406 [Drosophila subpalustris]
MLMSWCMRSTNISRQHLRSSPVITSAGKPSSLKTLCQTLNHKDRHLEHGKKLEKLKALQDEDEKQVLIGQAGEK